MGMANRLPVGAIVPPSGVGIGRVKVPVITPVTAVQLPEPNRIGCTLISMSGPQTKRCLEIRDMDVDSFRLVPIGPGHDDALRCSSMRIRTDNSRDPARRS